MLVASVADLGRAVAALAAGEGPVAVDAERASGFRYGHRAFLVQLRRDGAGTMLIDPMACPNLTGLDAALARTARSVLHAASQDLPCLAELGFRPRALFDTELAGRLLGFPRVGLGALVDRCWAGRWRRAMRRRTGRSARCPASGSAMRHWTWNCWWNCGTRWRPSWRRRARRNGRSRSSPRCWRPSRPVPGPDPWRRTSGIHRVHSRRGLADRP